MTHWSEFLTMDEAEKLENLKYGIRMIQQRCEARQKLKEKNDE